MKTKFILQMLAMLFVVMTTTAQQGINYKAIINDTDGNVLVNTPITVQFTILQDGETEVYKESHEPTTDANGIIIINIGEGTAIDGAFDAIDWGSAPHYLKTEIDKGEGLTDMGTAEFKVVPYAMHAQTTENAATKADVDKLEIRIKNIEDALAVLFGNDIDGDSFTEAQGDCDDYNPNINPGAAEIPGNEIDENCDGYIECGIAYCEPGWYDLNGICEDGCECQLDEPERSDPPLGNTCSTPIDLGVLSNDPGDIVNVIGNAVPAGDEDWYIFRIDGYCRDDCSGITDFDIRLKQNPGSIYRMDILSHACPSSGGNYVSEGISTRTTYKCPDLKINMDYCHEQMWIRIYKYDGRASCDSYELQISIGDKVPQ